MAKKKREEEDDVDAVQSQEGDAARRKGRQGQRDERKEVDEKRKGHSKSGKQAPVHEGRKFDRDSSERKQYGGWRQERGSKPGQQQGKQRVPDTRRAPSALNLPSVGAKRLGERKDAANRKVSSILNTHNAGVFRQQRH